MGRDVRVLSGGDLSKMLTLSDVIPAIESAYLAASQQQAQLYPVVVNRWHRVEYLASSPATGLIENPSA